MLMLTNFASAQTWMLSSAPSMNWQCFAESADGNTLLAEPAYPSGIIIISTNGGFTWDTNTLPTVSLYGQPYGIHFESVTASADGTKLAGANTAGFICTSTNTGATWTTNNVPAVAWNAIASSADGSRLVAVAGGGNELGPIYISTNAGAVWQPTSAPSNYWRYVASSADGGKILAAADSSSIPNYVSTDSGASWVPTSLATNQAWVVATSADGTRMVAAYYGVGPDLPGHVFTSTNSGGTWESNQWVSSHFESVALSADGNIIVLAGLDPVVFVSTDFGLTWATNALPGGGAYFTIASSADGGKLIAGALFSDVNSFDPGFSYISQSTYAPRMELAPSSTDFALSWIIPSTNFVLQQSSDLASWTDVTNVPTLNLSNLQNEVILSPSNSSGFYRLKTP